MVWKITEKLRRELLKARFGAHSITSGLAYLTSSDRSNIGETQPGIIICGITSSAPYEMDETYFKVGKKCKYPYRAIDRDGQTIEFMLCAKHDISSAK